MLDVSNHTDDAGTTNCVAAGVPHQQIFADWRSAVPVPIRNGLVHQNDRFAAGRVVLVERATLEQAPPPNAER